MDLPNFPVTLVVKAPNQKVQDHTVECVMGWTIKKLKRHLSEVYPSKPNEDQQRIIYSGKLLTDNLILKDILRQHDSGVHTVHLVCSPSSQGESNIGTPQPSPPVTPSSAGLRHRATNATTNETPGVQQQTTHAQNQYTLVGANNYNPHTPTTPGQPYNQQQQAMMMQHIYAQQMMQYMQLMHMQGGGHMTAAQNAAPMMADVGGAREPPANQPQPPQQDDNRNVRMNAQGGMDLDDDGDDINRDWLDWGYTFSRFSVLLVILYFYSTFNRFMVVCALCVAFYLYKKGWFLLERRNVPRQPAEQGRGQGQERPDAAADLDHPAPPTSEETNSAPETPMEPRPAGIMEVAWSFFSAFFTSLVPENPRAVNVN